MASSSSHDHKPYAASHLQTLPYLLPVMTAAIARAEVEAEHRPPKY